ncbi:MAG: hypothetical protein AB1714_10315 [Acidobacteriota bacterium]
MTKRLGGVVILSPLVLAVSITWSRDGPTSDADSTGESAAQWTAIGPGGGYVECVAFHPVKPKEVLCGTNGGGLLRSTNRGASWARMGPDIIWPYVTCISFSTSDPSIVYAGAGYGIYKSTNGGRTWIASGGTVLDSDGIYAVAVHPKTPLTVYVETGGHGIYKSVDGGKSWKWLENALGYGWVRELPIDSLNPKVMYAGVTDVEPQGVYKSADAGETWSHAGLVAEAITDLVMSPNASNTVFAACGKLYRSTDACATWGEIAQGIPDVLGVALDAQRPGIAYAATEAGVCKTLDSGDSWAVAGMQLKNLPVKTLGLSASNPSTICAGSCADGIFLSHDEAASWTISNKGLCAHQVWALSFDGKSAGTFYAGGRLWLARRTNRGSAWRTIRLPAFDSLIADIAVHPDDPETIYLSVPSYVVHKTTDGGATWRIAGPRGCTLDPLLIDPHHPDTVLVGTTERGIMRSSDGGRVWVSAGLSKVDEIICFALDSTSPGRLFVGTTDGLWKGTIDGSTWSRAGLASLAINCMASSSNGILYAGTRGQGLRRSDDAGRTWIDANTGLEGGCVSAIAIDPRNWSNLSVATVQGGIYRSTNGGATWTPMNDGIPPMLSTTVLKFDPQDPGTLYAGTEGGGIYWIRPGAQPQRE